MGRIDDDAARGLRDGTGLRQNVLSRRDRFEVSALIGFGLLCVVVVVVRVFDFASAIRGRGRGIEMDEGGVDERGLGDVLITDEEARCWPVEILTKYLNFTARGGLPV